MKTNVLLVCWAALTVPACSPCPPEECREDTVPSDAGSRFDGGEEPVCALPEGCPTLVDAGVDPQAAVEGVELMGRLAGLWTGPVNGTPLGDFTFMNVDFRPVGQATLLGRVDLDRDNFLTFSFDIETHGGRDVLVYRNGGSFLGVFREHRAELLSHTEDSWRFCHIERGCDYLEAHFEISPDDRLELEILVRGRPHMQWEAGRAETRTVPDPFPENLESQGDGTAGTPPMPRHRVVVEWTPPLARDADVWVLLPTRPCLVPSECVPARTSFAHASAGSRQATVQFDMIHPGTYYATVVLDRNMNFLQVFLPDSGDGIGLPNERVEVASQGSSSSQLRVIASIP